MDLKIQEYTQKIRVLGNSLINDYLKNNKVQTGINGPYDDPETEVRYLAHLIIIAAIEFLMFDKYEYKNVVVSIADRLFSLKGPNGLYRMRIKPGKDECNGTIGHAWMLEGLIYAYKVTGDDKYLDETEKILLKHEFNDKIGLWGRPLYGSDDSAIDFTFNHELWYAATLAEYLQIRDNKQLCKQLDVFLDKLPQIITIKYDGRVAHAIYHRSSYFGSFKQIISKLLDYLHEKLSKPSLRYKEIGYHLFNMMAFARIYNLRPNIPFFKGKDFRKALSFVSNECYINELSQDNISMDGSSYGNSLKREETSINIYGYPYNVPGLEIPYCCRVFKDYMSEDVAQTLLEQQFELTWGNGRFEKRCHDKVSINYRIYEYYRYLELN